MKRFVSISLVLTFVLYLGGVQLFYWIRIDSARNKAVTFIKTNKNNVVKLSFTTVQYNGLQWLDRNKEFVYKGKRYDISSAQYVNNAVVLKCYQDNEETEVAEAFEQFADKLFNSHQASQSGNGDIMSKITKEYLPLNFNPPHCILQPKNTFITIQQYPLRYSPVSDIWHPPALC